MKTTKYDLYQEQIKRPVKIWHAALYIRLSREDELKGESYSVSAQREILREYVRQKEDIVEYDCYIDDGWTGTNIDRPDFIRMMADIDAGRVDCVIVKDLSRFARNANAALELITEDYVCRGVRFIACNNMYDSEKSDYRSAATDCITLGVTNVINESISATTSVNVRGTLNLNRMKGYFIGSFAPYGYQKDPNDHHKLIIDEEAADIVRMIFQMFLSGNSIIGIAKTLNEMGVPNPTEYKKLKGANYKHPSGKHGDTLWPDSSVRRILANEEYIGNMVQGKNRVISYKNQVARACPREEWFIVENTHEAIISKEDFYKAQSLFKKKARPSPTKDNRIDIFAGLVHCADCGRSMNKKTNVHDYGTYEYYRCSTFRKMKKSVCSNHTIRIDKLYDALLAYLQKMISVAVDFESIIKDINSAKRKKNKSPDLASTINSQIAERERIVNLSLDLYPDYKEGILSKEEYLRLKSGFAEKISALDENIAKLEDTARSFENGVTEENAFIAHFKKYGNIDRLTRPMLTELVKDIRIHEGNKIEIDLNFADELKQIVEFVSLNTSTADEVA